MAAVFVVSYLLGAGILIAALLAIIVGWALSFLLLKPYADAATEWFAQRKSAQDAGQAPRFTAQIAADEAEEDAIIAQSQQTEQQRAPETVREPAPETAPEPAPESPDSQGEGDAEPDTNSELD